MSLQNHPFDSAVIGSISVSAARIIPASVSYGHRGSDVHIGPAAGETILLRLALRRVVSFEVFGDLRSVSTSAGADGAADCAGAAGAAGCAGAGAGAGLVIA